MDRQQKAEAYRQALDYLYTQLPMFHRIGPAAYKKDLTNTLALCEALGRPERRLTCIHVGGTNGKGSVSHLLAAACQAAGLKTGLYISPHYKDFRERIKINGLYIPRARVVEFVERVKPLVERIEPSFFELCVAMAFDHFAREQVDIAIVEVGLGGRLDSTNVIDPALSVITNISFDHMAQLGDTLGAIAGEKAGIIKTGRPVVIGESHPETAPVFVEKAREMNAPIAFADQNWLINRMAGDGLHFSEFDCQKGETRFRLRLDNGADYQAKNVATFCETILQMQAAGLPVEIRHAQYGAENLRRLTQFQGRWQVIGQSPVTLCDSAHNEGGLRAAFAQIERLGFPAMHIVTGFVADKDLDRALRQFPTAARYYFAKADIPRGLEAEQLRAQAAVYGLHGRAYTSVRSALRAARRQAQPDELVLVIGSIFVAAEVI